MIVDVILLCTIGFFGLWVINKHYDNAYDIEELQRKMRNQWGLTNKPVSTIKYTTHDIKGLQNENKTLKADMQTMQNDLIEFRQSLINIDAKYKIKDKWCVDTIEKLTHMQSKIMSEVI
jgi:predicted RNase H-like nuclease (RuvC/YqgF family)